MISAAATRMAGPPIDRWVLVTGQGEISDVLIRAKNQLMRASQPLRAVFAGSKHPRLPAAGCWYYDPIYLSN